MNKLLNSKRKELLTSLQCKEYGKILIARPLSPSLQNIITVGLFVIILTSSSVDEILKFDHLKWKLLSKPSSGIVYYAVQGGSNFWVCGWNPKVWPFKWKLLSSTFQCYCLLSCTRWFCLLNLRMNPVTLPFKWNLFCRTFAKYQLFFKDFFRGIFFFSHYEVWKGI